MYDAHALASPAVRADVARRGKSVEYVLTYVVVLIGAVRFTEEDHLVSVTGRFIRPAVHTARHLCVGGEHSL